MNLDITIAIADYQSLFLELISKELKCCGFNVSFVSKDGKNLLSLIKGSKFPPDICILNVKLNSCNGYTTIMKIRELYPTVRVLVLSDINTKMSVNELLQLGVVGFLYKAETTIDELSNAIQSIFFSGYYFNDYINKTSITNAKRRKKLLLTKIPKRELEFINLLIQNKSYQTIASNMNISIHTVETYRNNLFSRFNIHSKAELLSLIFANGIL